MDKERIASLPFDIDDGVRELPPSPQIRAQQIGTAYVWNSTTQELIPILPKDHPQYRENRDRLLEAFRRWNRGTSRTDSQTAVANPVPLTGSQRVALSRKRKRKDIVFVGIEVLPTERDALIGIGFLKKAERNDKIAVRDALYAYFEKYLDPDTLPPPT